MLRWSQHFCKAIAWDLRTASTLPQSEHVEEVELSKCACGVRVSLCSRQRRRKSLRMHHVLTKDENLRDRSRRTKKILHCDGKTDINMSIRKATSLSLISQLNLSANY